MKLIKSLFLTLLTLLLTLTASAGNERMNRIKQGVARRYLYEQTFELASQKNIDDIGWTFDGLSRSIGSDSRGKYLMLSLTNYNIRSAQTTWGNEIFFKDGESLLEDGTYYLKFEFCLDENYNYVKHNSEFTVFTNHTPIAGQNYRFPSDPSGYWQNYLFDLNQVTDKPYQFTVNGRTIETVEEDGTISYSIDDSDSCSFEAGAWYSVELYVDTQTREVEYTVNTITGDFVKSGSLVVPSTNENGDEISMLAEGLFILITRAGRYSIDNIEIFTETSEDYANVPVVGLAGIGRTSDGILNLDAREYAIYFHEGETLHLVGTNGENEVVEYDDCNGVWHYYTDKSGYFKVWTTLGGATSEVVEMYAACKPVMLPHAKVNISSVSDGFAKTYTISVSDAEVPLRPDIFIRYEFDGLQGDNMIGDIGAVGDVTVTQPGILKVTTYAEGYESTTDTIINDQQYRAKKTWDFARMTENEIMAAGFPEFSILNSPATTGFFNWTARKRLYYNLAGSEHKDEYGYEMVYDKVYPFGFVSEDNTDNVIKYTVIDNENKLDNEAVRDEIFEGLTVFAMDRGGHPNVGMIYRIGLFNDQTSHTYNSVIVHDLDAEDIVVVNELVDYGANSNHPVVSTDEEYYQSLSGEDIMYSVHDSGVFDQETNTYNVEYPLYRISTACTKITVYEPADTISFGDFEYEGVWYTITGINTCKTRSSAEDFVGNTVSGDLVIPDAVSIFGNIYTVTEIGDYSFRGNPNLFSVSIPASVTNIGTGAFSDCERLTSLVWNGNTRLQDEVVKEIGNPNLLVYVESVQFAPEGLDHNVVADDICDNLVLTPGHPFTPLMEFTAEHSEITKQFTQQTPIEGSAGWETLVLPFKPTTIVGPDGRHLVPFSVLANINIQCPFWLYEADAEGEWKAASAIDQSVPYLISMPNNDNYDEQYRIDGAVTFSTDEKTVIAPETCAPYATTWNSGREFRSLWLPLDRNEAANAMGLNVGISNLTNDEGQRLAPGSAFHADVLPLPLEAYVTRIDGRRAMPVIGGQSLVRMLSSKDGLRIVADRNSIIINSDSDRVVDVFTVDGISIRRVDVKGGETYTIDNLTRGIYIVAGRKITVK